MSITTQADLAKYLASGGKVQYDKYSYPRKRRSTSRRSTSSKRRRTSRFSGYRMVSAPTAQALKTKPSRTRFGPKGQSTGIVVSNKEYIGDVATTAGSSAFKTVLTTLISPVNSGLFPWLAGIAQKFDSYQFQYLTFHYEPACTSSATGQVMIAPDFDPNDGSPINWAAAAAYMGANHGSVWAPLSVTCSSKSLRKRKTYYGEMPSIPSPQNTSDVREVAVGRINILIDGVTNNGTAFAAATTLGKMYVSYKVSLYEPDYTNTLIAGASGVGAVFKASTAELTSIGVGGGVHVFNYLKLGSSNTGAIPFSINVNGDLLCTSPCELMVTQRVSSTAAVGLIPAPVVTNTSGLSAATIISTVANGADTSSRSDNIKMHTGDVISFTSPTAGAALTAYSVWIAPYPYSFA